MDTEHDFSGCVWNDGWVAEYAKVVDLVRDLSLISNTTDALRKTIDLAERGEAMYPTTPRYQNQPPSFKMFIEFVVFTTMTPEYEQLYRTDIDNLSRIIFKLHIFKTYGSLDNVLQASELAEKVLKYDYVTTKQPILDFIHDRIIHCRKDYIK